MKNFIKTLVLLFICYAATAQHQPYKMTQADKQKLHTIDLSQLDRAKDELERGRNNRTLLNIEIDYSSMDAQATADSGGTQEGFRWDVNANFADDSVNNFNLNWAAVTFDALAQFDANNNIITYPHNVSQITVDSVVVFFLHENNTGTEDTVIITIYEYTGTVGILVNAQDQITNNILHQDTFYWSTSMAPTGGQGFAGLIVRPDSLTLPIGQRFTVGVDFYGDVDHLFAVSASYKDLCFGACGGEQSIFPNNSFYRLILEQPGGSLSGVNPVILDCEDDNVITPGFCEYFYIQNIDIIAFVTADVPFSANAFENPGPICPGEEVEIGVTVIAGVEPYDFIWTENGNQVAFSRTAPVTPSITTTYNVKVTDANGDSVFASMAVTVHDININAGSDVSISCGQTATLNAVASGNLANSTFEWSNQGPQTLKYENVVAGTYTITARNGTGCTATDEIKVFYPGVNQVLAYAVDKPGAQACKGEPLNFTNNSSRKGSGWNFEWDFGDGTFSFGENPSHTYDTLTTGNNALLSSLQADSADCVFNKVYKEIRVRICDVGISPVSTLDEFIDIYPNPTEGVFNVNFSDIDNKQGFLSIFDIRGNEIYNEALSISGSAQRSIDLKHAAVGIYLVKIQLENEVLVRKLNVNR